jgi:hypothetical protein
MDISGSGSSLGGANPGLRAPGRTGGGEGGVVRREGRNQVKAIRNPDSHDPNGLLEEAGAGSGGYESSCKPGLRPSEATGATGSGGFELQGAPDPLEVILSG